MRSKEQIYSEIELRAEALQKSDGITKADAVVKALHESPELYAEYCRAPHADPQPAPPARETVALFVKNQLERRAVEIQKARNLSASDAFFEAVSENERLVTASRKFAGRYMDEIVPPPVHKTPVQKVIPAPVAVRKAQPPVKQTVPVTVKKARTFNEVYYGRA